MRFELVCKIKNNEFPVEYSSSIMSFIKSAISKCNEGKYYESFFKENTRKDYTFAVMLPKSTFQKDKILLENNEIKISFSTADSNKTGFIMFNAFMRMRDKSYPLPNGNSMTLTKIIMNKSDVITNSRAIFKTKLGSSVCLRDHNRETNKDIYYCCADDNFREKLIETVKRQLINAEFSEKEVNDLTINNFSNKKVVVKFYKRYIDATTGMFEVKANNEVLQYLYDVGLGSRRNSGFAMLDLVTQDLV